VKINRLKFQCHIGEQKWKVILNKTLRKTETQAIMLQLMIMSISKINSRTNDAIYVKQNSHGRIGQH
jgi:hypothetical protein